MDGNSLVIGVLALQGAVSEHLEMIEKCGARGIGVKRASGLTGIDGLIIPGGESTTIGRLLEEYGFFPPITEISNSGVPIFGTCTGLIVLAKRVRGKHGPILGLADIEVERNAFGRQVDSFERDIIISGIESENEPFRAVFIRAPVVLSAGPEVRVMARIDEGIIMARDRNYLVAAFHPELTPDLRVHQYFLKMVRERKEAP